MLLSGFNAQGSLQIPFSSRHLSFGGPVFVDHISNCPLGRVLTCENLIYLLNLQVYKFMDIFCECYTLCFSDSASSSRDQAAVTKSQPMNQDKAVEPREQREPTQVAIFLKKARNYIENHRQHICYLLVFYSVVVVLFFERFYCEYKLWLHCDQLLILCFRCNWFFVR